jgi:hypothetical protein
LLLQVVSRFPAFNAPQFVDKFFFGFEVFFFTPVQGGDRFFKRNKIS